MHYKRTFFLLSLLGAVSSMKLKSVQPAAIKEHNVLYFEARDKPSVLTVSSSQCPNATFFCSENLTCCSSAENRTIFGCCPIPKGVCCNDGIHCCPPNSICDVAKGLCYIQNKQGHRLITADWNVVDHLPRQEQLLKVSAEVVCPGGTVSCPSSSTCCKSSSDYQCCPYPQALCCRDGIHCCPRNYRCNISTGACTKQNSVVSWTTKHPAKSILNGTENSVVCPGGQVQCPDGNTCCLMQSGQYGCCTYPKAVCCSDGIHCCPEGYTCDMSAGICFRSDDALSAFLQKHVVTTKKDSVTCQDNSECSIGSTCCKLASDQYGCCPLERAVCCSDHLHCCPDGYQCDVSAGTCSKGDDILTWLTKKPSRPAS